MEQVICVLNLIENVETYRWADAVVNMFEHSIKTMQGQCFYGTRLVEPGTALTNDILKPPADVDVTHLVRHVWRSHNRIMAKVKIIDDEMIKVLSESHIPFVYGGFTGYFPMKNEKPWVNGNALRPVRIDIGIDMGES